MKNHQPSSDDRSSLAKAFDTATEVFSACLMMVLPAIGGHFLDRYLNTSVVFTLLGMLFGLLAGVTQIVKIVNRPDPTPSTSDQKPPDDNS